MAKLGSHKRPAVVRVRSPQTAAAIMEVCDERGWQVIVGVEPDKPEDISDVEKLLDPPTVHATPRPGRNEPCSCGSGLKYKKCCLRTETAR